MAKIEEYCEVRTASGIYRDWTSVAVSYTVGDYDQPRKFRLMSAEPSTRQIRLVPGDRVDIALAGQVVIQEGYIFSRQAAFDANRRGIVLDGFSKDGLITKASVNVPGGEFRGYDISAIASRVLQPFGVSFRLQNPPPGATDPFPRVAVRRGETAIELITRLAKQRGLRLSTEANGTLVGGPPDAGRSVGFAEGRNILSASCQIVMPHVAQIVGQSQKSGSDSLFGKQVSEVQATGAFGRGPEGLVQKFVAEMPLSPKELQTRTNMAMADLQSSMLRANIVYQGWLKPGSDDLWKLGEPVTVRSSMLFPTAKGDMSLRVWSVTYSQDANAGTTTGIELVNEAAWSLQYPDARAPSSFYNQPATPAKPDTST